MKIKNIILSVPTNDHFLKDSIFLWEKQRNIIKDQIDEINSNSWKCIRCSESFLLLVSLKSLSSFFIIDVNIIMILSFQKNQLETCILVVPLLWCLHDFCSQIIFGCKTAHLWFWLQNSKNAGFLKINKCWIRA